MKVFDLEKEMDKLYDYTLCNGDTVRWQLKSILPLVENMGRTYIGCIHSGRLQKVRK